MWQAGGMEQASEWARHSAAMWTVAALGKPRDARVEVMLVLATAKATHDLLNASGLAVVVR